MESKFMRYSFDIQKNVYDVNNYKSLLFRHTLTGGNQLSSVMVKGCVIVTETVQMSTI